MNKLALLFLFFLFFQWTGNAQSIAKTAKNNTELANQKTANKVIIIYGSPDCHYCTTAKQLLIDHKIDFVFCDIDHDKVALQEMLGKLRAAKISTSGLGIPVIDKYGELFQNNGNFDDFLKKLIE